MPAAGDLDLTNYDLLPPVEFFALSGGINNRTVGVHTGAGDFVLKVYTAHPDPATILYEHNLLRWLDGKGLSFRVPIPVLARDEKTLCRTAQGWQALFPRLPGVRPDHRDPQQVEAIGSALGELQVTLARYRVSSRPGLFPYGDLERVHPHLPDPFRLTPGRLGLPDVPSYQGLFAWWRDELEALRHFVKGPYQSLPRQVIHGDFGPGNTLIKAGQITAVLDFDFATPDARALDVASGLTFTMRMWENPEPHVMARSFFRGYRCWIELTEEELEALPWLMRLRNAVAAVWWLGRALQAGEVRAEPKRLEEMQQFVHWLGKGQWAEVVK